MSNWIRLTTSPNASGGDVIVYTDPSFSRVVKEAWFYAELYLSSAFLATFADNDFSIAFLKLTGANDRVQLGLVKRSGAFKWWAQQQGNSGSPPTVEFGSLVAATWYRVEIHVNDLTGVAEVRVDEGSAQNIHGGTTSVSTGMNLMLVRSPKVSAIDTTKYLGVDNIGYSLAGWISDGHQAAWIWDFEGANPLVDAAANSPDPPFDYDVGSGGGEISVQTGAPGPGPGLPAAVGRPFTDGFDPIEWFFDPAVSLGLATDLGTDFDGNVTRGKIAVGGIPFNAQRLDFPEGGDPSQVYWLSFAFAIPVGFWAYMTDIAVGRIPLPGFSINLRKPSSRNVWFVYLVPDSSTSGHLESYLAGSLGIVTEGVWHTLRYGLRSDGAASTEEVWLDGVQVLAPVTFDSGFAHGVWGPWVGS